MQVLLNPITDTTPTGPDLSFSPEFDQIAELRRFDDPTLDQGEWVRDIKVADWSGVAQLCAELLSTRTKDLRLACWMTDALSRSNGFAGMVQGLGVCADLCETFWEELHPLPDEDAPTDELNERYEQRIGTLSWLLGQLAEATQTQPLVVGKADGGAYNAAYGRRTIEAVRSRKRAGEGNNEPTEEEIALALSQTPGDSLMASLAHTQKVLVALARLQQVIDAHLGVSGPNFSAARNALQLNEHMLARFAKERGLYKTADTSSELEVEPTGELGSTKVSAQLPPGAPANRAQALVQLRQVAAFFRQTEPHSPVAYLAEKAAKWGELPLHEWLRSVLKDPGSMAQLEELLGVEPPSPGP